jgi:diguanylate cyclase (GGDEF)-like protein
VGTTSQDLLARIRRQQTLDRIRQQQEAGGAPDPAGATTQERPTSEPPLTRRPARASGPGPGASAGPQPPARHLDDPHAAAAPEPEPEEPSVLSRIGRGVRAVGSTLARAVPGGEPFIQRDREEPEEEEPKDDRPLMQRALDALKAGPSRRGDEAISYSPAAEAEKAGRGVGAMGEDVARQVGRGASEVGYRTAIGSSELVGADRTAANLRAGRELARETYGEADTGLGMAANIGTQLVGEGTQFMVPGLAAQRVARAAGGLEKASRFTRLLASPEGRAQRAIQSFVTGAPIDVAISQAGPEESMAGALAELTGDTELGEVAADPVSRGAFEVLTGWGLGEVFGEVLTAAQRARAKPRASELGRAAAEATGAEAEAMQRAIDELPAELQTVAREAMVEKPARPTLRRRLAEVVDPTVRSELDDAYTDPLTGLGNQTAFQRAKGRLDAEPGTEFVILDVDNLKAVNDNLGLEAGDDVLREIGAVVKGHAREAGIEPRGLFRAGGDEFVIAAPKGQADELGRAISDAFGERPIEGTPFTNSVRYGVGDTFSAADEAAGAAKAASGKARARDVVAPGTREDAPGGVSRETPTETAPAPREAPDAPAAAARQARAAEPRPGEAPESAAARAARPKSMDAAASRPLEEIARAAQRPLGRAAVGAAAGAAVGVPEGSEVTPARGALIGAAVALGLPGIGRALARSPIAGRGGFAAFSGKYWTKAEVALASGKTPGKAPQDVWMSWLKKQGATDDELELISRRMSWVGSEKTQYTTEDLQGIVREHGLRSRLEEEVLTEDADPDALYDLEQARERLAEAESEELDLMARIDDYDAGGVGRDAIETDVYDGLLEWVDHLPLDRPPDEMRVRHPRDSLLDDLFTAATDMVREGERTPGRVIEALELRVTEALRQHNPHLGYNEIDDVMDAVPRRVFHDVEDRVVALTDLAEEIEEMQVELERVMDEVVGYRSEVEAFGEERAGEGGARFPDNYQQPGGYDYHELLVKLRGSTFVKSEHFPQPGVMGFTRAKMRDEAVRLDRSDIGPVYHVEERQADHHQVGRKEGYRETQMPAGWTVREFDPAGDADWLAKAYGRPELADELKRGDMDALGSAEDWRYVVQDGAQRVRAHGASPAAAEHVAMTRPRAVPDAPWKSTNQWTGVMLRRELVEAIDRGARFFTWASGEQAGMNYSLAQFGIRRLEYDPTTGRLLGFDANGRQTVNEIYPVEADPEVFVDASTGLARIEPRSYPRTLRDAIGKDLAEKLLAQSRAVVGASPPARQLIDMQSRSDYHSYPSGHMLVATPDYREGRPGRVLADGPIRLVLINDVREELIELVGDADEVLQQYDDWAASAFGDVAAPRVEGPHQLELDENTQIGGRGHNKLYNDIAVKEARRLLKELGVDVQIEAVTLPGTGAVVGGRWISEVSMQGPSMPGLLPELSKLRTSMIEGGFGRQIYDASEAIRHAFADGLSGEDALERGRRRYFDELLGTFTDEAKAEGQAAWDRAFTPAILEEILAVPAYKAPPTNLGFEITDELAAKVAEKGQRLGFAHPALIRPAGGAAIGAVAGAASSDELDVDPVLAAFLGASLGAGFGLRGMGRRGPSPTARRALETLNPTLRRVRTGEAVDALAPAAQAGERLPSAGKFYDDPAAASADLVSPIAIVEGLSAAMSEAFEGAGLGLGLKTAAGQVRGKGPLRGALGIFKTRAQVVRQIDISDVPVFGHEAGHAMHKLFFGTTPAGALSDADLKVLPGAIRGELQALSDAIGQPDKLREGWAEVWRRYLDNPDALGREAPQTLAFIEQRLTGFPELTEAWGLAREDWRRYRESDALSRISSKVSVGDREVEVLTVADRWSRFRTSVIDDMEPVRRITQAIRETVGIDSFAEEADALARLVRGSVGVGMHFLEHGSLNFHTLKKVGPALAEVLGPVKPDLDDFRLYMVSRRAQELHTRDKMTGFRAEDVDSAVRQLEAKHGRTFTRAFDGIQKWNESLLRYLRDAGVVSPDSYKAILDLNQSYVPFYRVIEGGRAGGLGETYGHLFSPIKQLKGSGRDVIDPLESLAKNALLYTQVAQKQQVSRALAALADKEGVGPILEELGTPIKRSQFRLGEIEKQLEDVLPGADQLLGEARAKAKKRYEAATAGMTPEEVAASGIVLEDPAEEILAFYRPGDFMGRQNTISVLREGKRVYYEVDAELYASLEGLNREQLDGWARFLGLPARTLRAGATLAPEFLIRNPARDQVAAFIQSEYGIVPGLDLARGMFELLRKGDAYQQWLSAGGYRAALTSLDRNTMQASVRQLVEAGGVENVIKHPFDALQALSALLEDGTRMGEFLRARKKLGTSKQALQRAALASREVSIDFARHGAKTAAVRNLSAFWNARLQGYDRMFRAAKSNPRRFAAKAFGIITMPSLLEYYANMDDPDYWEQPQWKRDLFWLIKIGDSFAAIPKPFELGLVFGTLPVRILDSAIGGPGGGHELRGFLEELVKGEVTGTIPTPNAIQPLLENAVNYSFFLRRPIVPRSEQEIHPELQAGPYTSEAAKMLARWTSGAPILEDVVGSPRQIDNLLFAWTGGLGRLATEVTDPLLEGRVPFLQEPDVPEIGKRFTELPGIRGVTDPQAGFSSESVERFYQLHQQARVAVNSLRFLDRIQDAEAYERELNDPEMAELRSREPDLRAAADDLAELRAQLEAIRRDPDMTSQEKRQAVDELGLEARRIAQSVLGRQLPGD